MAVPFLYKGNQMSKAEIRFAKAAMARLREGKPTKGDCKRAADLIDKCLVYEGVLKGIKGHGTYPCLSLYERMRLMYLDALEALGYCEVMLLHGPKKGKTVVMKRDEVDRRNERVFRRNAERNMLTNPNAVPFPPKKRRTKASA